MEEVIKKINELQNKYLDRKNECLLNENLSGENMYHLALEVAERCKEFINDFKKCNKHCFHFLQDQHQKTEKLNKAKSLFDNKSEKDLDFLSYNERLNLLIKLREIICNEKP